MPDFQGKDVMVLGGFGLVGRAVCHELLKLNPKRIVVCSLFENESLEACKELENYKETIKEELCIDTQTKLIPIWGDIFAREEYKNILTRNPQDPQYLESMITDTFEDLAKVELDKNLLYSLLIEFKPDIVIDSVNTATGVAYQDIYKSVIELRKTIGDVESKLDGDVDVLKKAVSNMVQRSREHMAGIYLPRLIRHVQILYKGMEKARCQYYIKIGTTGTGGMGLNIPYTHSEEKPSQKLLSKSAVGGAHSLLLYLMSKTPDMAITMEFKPAAAISWKKIGYGEIHSKGKPIRLCDNPPEQAFELADTLTLETTDGVECSENFLKAAYIDSGENGVFSSGEFSAITTTGQMEYITPEEIATMVVDEIKGGNTGYDIMSSLSNSVMRSTYRAGFMRQHAVNKLREIEKEHGEESVAFEILGPPRLSKLLYEAYLIKTVYQTPDNVLAADVNSMAKSLAALVTEDRELRRKILSIGIPILMPDGKKMLRGSKIVIPPYRGQNEIPMTDQDIEIWAHDGWVDLREENMRRWQHRMEDLSRIIARHDWSQPSIDTSSAFNRKDFMVNGAMNIGEIVGWIFNVEEKGARKYYNVGVIHREL